MRVLLLGHKGMLGNVIHKYYLQNNIDLVTTEFKWADWDLIRLIKQSNCDFLINCIGINPQKNQPWYTLKFINFELPEWLSENFKGYMLHPTTNGEFKGNSEFGKLYGKHDYKNADDDYGVSKSLASMVLIRKEKVKQIRTAIFGPELNNKHYFFEQILNQENVWGNTNYYWNGITTLEWAKQSLDIIKHWNSTDKIIQLGTKPISLYDLVVLINKVFKCHKKVKPIRAEYDNRCIASDYKLPNIKSQLEELKIFMFAER